MLPMSLDCPFLIAPHVSRAQCCLCLWIVHSWLPLMCLVPNVACVSGLSILDCPFCVWCPMLPMSLDIPFLITPSVSSAQCCLCFWIVHSWLPLLCLVPNVACVSRLSIIDCPSVSNAQCCLCLWIVHSSLFFLCLVTNVVRFSGLSILDCPFCF